MKQRIDYRKAAPAGLAAMSGLEAYTRQCGLAKALFQLVKMRASQINGCAYCLDMHSKDARAALGYLTLTIIAINGWNRLAIAFHAPAGSCRPGRK